MGKGSKPRPVSIPRKQFEDNWDKIFNNKDKEKKNEDTTRRSK